MTYIFKKISEGEVITSAPNGSLLDISIPDISNPGEFLTRSISPENVSSGDSQVFAVIDTGLISNVMEFAGTARKFKLGTLPSNTYCTHRCIINNGGSILLTDEIGWDMFISVGGTVIMPNSDIARRYNSIVNDVRTNFTYGLDLLYYISPIGGVLIDTEIDGLGSLPVPTNGLRAAVTQTGGTYTKGEIYLANGLSWVLETKSIGDKILFTKDFVNSFYSAGDFYQRNVFENTGLNTWNEIQTGVYFPEPRIVISIAKRNIG